MANDVVLGKDCILYFFDSGIYKMYACSTSISLTVTTDMIETSVTGTGDFATFEPTKHSFEGSMEGICNLDVPGMLTLPDLRQKQLSKVLLLCRFERTSSGGSVYSDEIKFYISESSDAASFNGVNTFNVSLRGTGSIILVNTVTPALTGKMNRIEFAFSGAEHILIYSVLIGKDVQVINVDGTDSLPIITTGTPVNKEAKFTKTSGTIEFPITFDAGTRGYILYQD